MDIKIYIETIIEKVRSGIDVEETNLDLKQSWWDLNNNEGKNEFRKDVCAMANTSKGDSIIIIGLDKHGKLHDAPLPEDEANIQSKHKEHIEPRISLSIKEVRVEDKTISVILIPHSSNRPHTIVNYQTKNCKYDRFIPVRFGTSTTWATRKDLDEMFSERLATKGPDLVVDFYEPFVRWDNFAGFGNQGGCSFAIKLTLDNLGDSPEYITKINLVEEGGENWKAEHYWVAGYKKIDPSVEIGAGKRIEALEIYISDTTPGGLRNRRPMPDFDKDRLYLVVNTRSSKEIKVLLNPGNIMEG